MAFLMSRGFTFPKISALTIVCEISCFSSVYIGLITELCSICVKITWSPFFKAPFMTVLSASVAFWVKMNLFVSSPLKKEQIINRVLLNNESIISVSIDEGLLNAGILANWIKNYKENCYNIVERKRGRLIMPKITKKKENETKDEKIKRLEEENLYLKAELEYSKKLRAVVQARKNQQQKKK